MKISPYDYERLIIYMYIMNYEACHGEKFQTELRKFCLLNRSNIFIFDLEMHYKQGLKFSGNSQRYPSRVPGF